jgi:putative ABC transport system permease protein
MTGLAGRVSRILVQPAAGAEADVRAALIRLAAGRLNVEGAGYDEALFAKAAAASNQSTALFAVISALVGFLFAFNAMLLSVPQRRKLIADLRRDGYTPRTVIGVLLLDALVLGVLACVLGLAIGEELSIHLFHSNPGYLSSAFAVGSQRVVGFKSVAVGCGGGMLAAIVAVLSPLRDILSRDPLAAIASTERVGRGAVSGRLMFVGAVCLAAATVVLLAAPKLAILGVVFLIASLLLLLAVPLAALLGLVRRLAPTITSAVPHVAVMELDAARARAVAIAATGAIAVFGSVAIQGAHGNLLSGLENAAHDMNAFTDVWVSPAGSYNLLKTTPVHPDAEGQAGRAAGGARGADLPRRAAGHRRAPSVGDRATDAVDGPAAADAARGKQPAPGHGTGQGRRLGRPLPGARRRTPSAHRRSGRAAHPQPEQLPGRSAVHQHWLGARRDHHERGRLRTRVGQHERQRVQRPDGARRLAGPGRPRDPTALGSSSGWPWKPRSSTPTSSALSRQGLQRLTQIATLILIAAVLAMAAAMGNMVWQRRPRLAKLKLEGFSRVELWRTIMLESLLLLGAGCLSGAAFGLYGQQLLDRALANVINFPVSTRSPF